MSEDHKDDEVRYIGRAEKPLSVEYSEVTEEKCMWCGRHKVQVSGSDNDGNRIVFCSQNCLVPWTYGYLE